VTHETEGLVLANQINRMLRQLAATFGDLTDEQLNQSPPFAPGNTMYQLAVHVAGSTRFWTITDTGGTDFHRDRDSEFVAVGPGEPVRADYERLYQEIQDHLGGLTAEDLVQPVAVPSSGFTGWQGDGPPSKRDGVLHALEHIGIHLGHMQIQRQLIGLAPLG
jgi:hypothetical protein